MTQETHYTIYHREGGCGRFLVEGRQVWQMGEDRQTAFVKYYATSRDLFASILRAAAVTSGVTIARSRWSPSTDEWTHLAHHAA